MKDKKMRCHPSVILENSWKVLIAIVICLLPGLVEDITDGLQWDDFLGVLLIVIAILIVALYQTARWYTTTMLLEEDSLIVERGALNKKILTIQIQSISSINLEQNLFERVIKTSRVKIDTNSLSTATETDVNLIFATETALQLKAELEQIIRGEVSAEKEVDEVDVNVQNSEQAETITYETDLGDILMHSLYNFSFLYVVTIFLALMGSWGYLIDMMVDSEAWLTKGGFAVVMVVGVAVIVSVIGAMIKPFVTYYNLTVTRQQNKLLLSYGLLKKRMYTVPIEKINAVRVEQGLIARICRKYHATIECVGMGDEDDETAQLTLYLPYEKLMQRLQLLIPEYELSALGVAQKVDQKVLWHKMWSHLYLLILYGVSLLVCAILHEEGVMEVLPIGIASALLAAVVIWNQVRIMFAISTERVGIGEDTLVLTRGSFAKHTIFLRYSHIQHLEFQQSPIGRITGLYDGTANFLAKIPTFEIPMIFEGQVEMIKEKCLAYYSTGKKN